MPISALSEKAMLFCMLCILLVPFAGAGLALINTGLGRSRSAAHLMTSSLCVISVAAVVYFVCGFGWQGFSGDPAHFLIVRGKAWSWIGAQPFFRRRRGPGKTVSLTGCHRGLETSRCRAGKEGGSFEWSTLETIVNLAYSPAYVHRESPGAESMLLSLRSRLRERIARIVKASRPMSRVG